MSDVTSHKGETGKRAFLKCPQCRKDGKKCLDNDENDDDEELTVVWRRCRRCAKLGHPCGPRVKAVRRTKQGSKRGSNRHVNVDDVQSSESKLQSSSVSPEPLRTPAEQLEECLAIQQILYRWRCDNRQLQQRLLDSSSLSQREHELEAANSRLNGKFESLVRAVNQQGQDPNDEGSSALEILRLRFENGQLRHQALGQASYEVQQSTPTTPRLSRNPDSDLTACTWSVMQGMDHATFKPLEYPGVFPTTSMENYFKAQVRLQSLGEEIFPAVPADANDAITRPRKRSRPAARVLFPAAQIAYINFDKAAAFKLATQDGVLDVSENVFNQSLIHLVANASDHNFWQGLVKFDAQATINAALKGGDYSPLNLTAILNDDDMFCSIVRRRLNVKSETRMTLQHAVSAKSHSIVDTILELKTVVQTPYTREAACAIALGHEEIVQKLVVSIRAWSSREDVQMLADAAERANMFNVASLLRGPRVPVDAERLFSTLGDHTTSLMDGQWSLAPESTGENFRDYGQSPYPGDSQTSCPTLFTWDGMV